ncbi:MAG: hypothetical protein DMG23_09745 [Acidobacteria bacterium]|nr:MAG: hypothetical protein DMG23_09745 [Acidobacteriota bacterium]
MPGRQSWFDVRNRFRTTKVVPLHHERGLKPQKLLGVGPFSARLPTNNIGAGSVVPIHDKQGRFPFAKPKTPGARLEERPKRFCF